MELKINIKCDFNVPEVAQAVQKAVIEKIEKITGMTVTKVNVIIQEIEDPVAEENEEEDGETPVSAIPLN